MMDDQDLTMGQYMARAEALLFAAGDPVSSTVIAEVLDLEEEHIEPLMRKLKERYDDDPGSGLCLKVLNKEYILTTKESCADCLSRFFRPNHLPALTNASYETLAAILYNQPVTRAQVEEVRGVNSDSVITRLEERGLVEACGVLEQVGRPTLYRVSRRFLLEAGLESAEDLPPIDLLMYGTIREAEEEGESE